MPEPPLAEHLCADDPRIRRDDDAGGGRRRSKNCARSSPSKQYRAAYGHTPLSIKEEIPWHCRRLMVATGAQGALPVMDKVRQEATRRKLERLSVSATLSDSKRGVAERLGTEVATRDDRGGMDGTARHGLAPLEIVARWRGTSAAVIALLRYISAMATIQIRDIPEESYEVLRRRARREGRSLQTYLRQEIIDLAARPTKAEALARIDTLLQRVQGEEPTADSVLAAIGAERR